MLVLKKIPEARFKRAETTTARARTTDHIRVTRDQSLPFARNAVRGLDRAAPIYIIQSTVPATVETQFHFANSIGKKAVITGFDAKVSPLRAIVIIISARVLKERKTDATAMISEMTSNMNIV